MDGYANALNLLRQRLRFSFRAAQSERHTTLRRLHAALEHLNPVSTMARGFSIVRDAEGRIVAETGQVSPGDTLTVQFARGEADAQVLSIRN